MQVALHLFHRYWYSKVLHPMKSLVSNGGYKFHLAPLAAELEKRNCLAGLITAGWPSKWQRKIAEAFPSNAAWKRFLDRHEPISEQLIHSSFKTEILLKTGDLNRKYSQKIQQLFHEKALNSYSKYAITVLEKIQPSIYHFRSGYGNESIVLSQTLEIPAVCDHSIAYPTIAEYMVKNQGEFPSGKELLMESPLSRLFAKDIQQADYIIVNSDFVKQTCVHAGINENLIFVVYLGIDNKFASYLPTKNDKKKHKEKPGLIYVGGWQKRKGVETLIEALSLGPQVESLIVAGGIDPELRSSKTHINFFNQPYVNYKGIVKRSDLPSLLADNSIFVFPSYCEGSARVIFEAMAAGCYIITTPNSGSIVKDGVHGAVVPPGDPVALASAINFALNNEHLVSEIGASNSDLVISSYNQKNYADNIINVYEKILASK